MMAIRTEPGLATIAGAVLFIAGAGACSRDVPAPRKEQSPVSRPDSSRPTASDPASDGAPISPSDARAPAAPARVLTIAPTSAAAPAYLMIVMHGVRADADDLYDVGRSFARVIPGATILHPDGLQPYDQAPVGRQWFSIRDVSDATRAARVRAAGGDLSAWIDRELARLRVAPERLVVAGFSQGATMAAWLTLHRKPSPAAAILFSGRVAEDEPAVAGATSTPVYWAHGTADAVIPVSVVDPGARTLESWGARVTKRIYPGLGHSIAPDELHEAQEFLREALTRSGPRP